jgi:ABC-type multidrug transport system fused ATPase/permease subunit
MNKVAKLNYDFYENNVEENRKFGYYSMVATTDSFAKDIRIYQMDKMINKYIEEDSNKSAAKYKSFTDKSAKYEILGAISSAILLLLSYLYVGGKAYFEIISIGSIITVVGAISNFANSLITLISEAVQAKTMLKYLRFYFDYIELPEDVEKGLPLPQGDLVLSFEDVYYKYEGNKEYALNGVSFTITPNKKTAIVGPNGAGKSTIIKLIARFYKPNKGRITLNGIDINLIDGEEYQKVLGILFQDFSLFDFTIGQNVSSSLEYDDLKVKNALDLVDFNYNNEKKLPNKLNTFIGVALDDGVDFSGGEKQKIAIARALYKNSPIILLDEPTSALDPKSELEVYTSIAKLTNKKTALYISHRMSSTKFCDNIIVLDKGNVVQVGSHKELIKKEGLYSTLFNNQAKYYI